jgi:hypothetical protein
MDGARILAYVTGTVDQELLARNEYLTAENRILKAQLNGRLKLSDAERGRARRDRSSPWPQGPRRPRGHSPAGHHPGLVSQASRPQVRWLGASRSGQASDQARGRAADHSHGQGEPGLGL